MTAKAVDPNSGKSLAVHLRIEEIEDKLRQVGYGDEKLAELRRECEQRMETSKHQRDLDFKSDGLKFLSEAVQKYDGISYAELKQAIEIYSESNPLRKEEVRYFLETFETTRKEISNGSIREFQRFSAGLFLMNELLLSGSHDPKLLDNMANFTTLNLVSFVIAEDRLSEITSEQTSLNPIKRHLGHRSFKHWILKPISEVFGSLKIAKPDEFLSRLEKNFPEHYKTTTGTFRNAIKIFKDNARRLPLGHHISNIFGLTMIASLTVLAPFALTDPQFSEFKTGFWLLTAGLWTFALNHFGKEWFSYNDFKELQNLDSILKRLPKNMKKVSAAAAASCRLSVSQ